MRLYAWDKANCLVIYRNVGEYHGDGQVDDEENPVWLVAADQNIENYRELPDVYVE